MSQSRWKSKVVWASIASAVVLALQAVLSLEPTKVDVINGVINAVLTALTVFGVLNNPTNKTGF